MNWAAIQQAMETYLVNLDLGLEFAWENMKYNAKPGVSYLRVIHVPVNTEKLTLGTTGVMGTDGIMVVGVNYPAGIGSGAALEKADAIAAAFLPGTSIAAGSGTIVFSKTAMETKEPSSQPDWWVLPILVHYTAMHNY
jgi:hypothetical protein